MNILTVVAKRWKERIRGGEEEIQQCTLSLRDRGLQAVGLFYDQIILPRDGDQRAIVVFGPAT